MDQPDNLETLMLIDDDSIYLMLCQRTIKRSGKFKKVLTFNYADEALAYMEENKDEKIDLIFLDINMPRMNGFEFLAEATERLKDEFRANIVIMLTTSIHPSDIEKSKRYSNVKGYMAKPLTDKWLERAIDLVQDASSFDELVMIDTDRAA
jgi:two-component SAPR family response regulator